MKNLLAGWVLPGIILAVVPKCPACVVGYVWLLTGVGISVSVGASIRWGVIAFCCVMLCLAAIRLWIYRFSSPVAHADSRCCCERQEIELHQGELR